RWKAKHEARADLAVGELERAAHPLRQLPADREAEAEAALAARVAPALEALEYELAFLRRDAPADVAHGQRCGLAGGGDGDRHRPPRRAEAKRVVHQDPRDPRDAVRVARHPARAVAGEL